jgi:hypothetical protein
MTNVYLDIDGVILANETHLANYANEFVKFLVDNFDVYWLTTHCKGDATVPVTRFGHLFDEDVIEYLKKIKPTTWEYSKTEAIDFEKPFLWFDDDLWDEERDDLIKNNALASWIEVDLNSSPDRLKELIETYKRQ